MCCRILSKMKKYLSNSGEIFLVVPCYRACFNNVEEVRIHPKMIIMGLGGFSWEQTSLFRALIDMGDLEILLHFKALIIYSICYSL